MRRITSLVLSVLMIFLLMSSLVTAENTVQRYTVLVLDTSGTQNFYSNSELIYTADSAISYVKQASTKFVSDVLGSQGNNQIAVVQYNSYASVVSDFSNDAYAINARINALSANNSACCIAAGLEKANELLSAVTTADADKNVVLVTTGFTNNGKHEYSGHYNSSTIGSNWENMSTEIKLYAYANVAYRIAEKVKETATVYTLGLFQTMEGIPQAGKNVAEFFRLTAKDLASSPTHFYEVDDPDNLAFTFDEIVDSIINPLQLDLSYEFENILPSIEEPEGYVEIKVHAKITNISNKESVNSFVRLKETPGVELADNETLEHSLGNIPANESRTTVWTLRVPTPDGEKEYGQTVVVGSENSVAVEQTILMTITGTIDVFDFSASDRWGFSHGSVGNYFIDSDCLEYLLSHYDTVESDNLRREYNEAVSGSWGGSCHGMSLAAFLFKSNRLTPQYWDQKYNVGSNDNSFVAENINELYADESRTLINYYYLTQYGPEQREVFKAALKRGDNKNIETIVSMVQNNAILFGFQWETKYTKDVRLANGEEKKKGSKDGSGHTIILYGISEYNENGWEINGKTYRNRIQAYDVNYMQNTGEVHFYYDKFINYRWTLGLQQGNSISECYFTDTANKQFLKKTINFVTNDMNAIDFRNVENKTVEEQVAKNSAAYITANHLTDQIRIMDKTGKYVDIDGLVTDGELDCLTYYNNTVVVDGDSQSDLNIIFEETSEFTVENTENIENLELNVLFDDFGLSTKVTNADDITFNSQGKIALNGENSDFELSLVANEQQQTTSWFKTIISGKNTNAIEMLQNSEGIVINGDNLKNLKITMKDKIREKTQVITSEQDSILIKTGDDEEPVIMLDSDGDGTYDKILEAFMLELKATIGGEILSQAFDRMTETTSVEIEAKVNDGYVFTGWTSSNGGTFENDRELKTQFVMPSGNTTVTANFRARTFFDGIRFYFKDLLNNIISWFANLRGNITAWIANLTTSITDGVSNLIENIMDRISDLFIFNLFR